MSKEIKLGAIVFKTKKAVTEYLYKLYEEKEKGFRVYPGDEYFNFFFDLLRRHPEFEFKTRFGIEYFNFGSNPLHNFTELQVVGSGGRYEPFSPKEAISGSVKKENRLNEAMRIAIESQIDYFINTNPKPKCCPLCKVTKDYYHVDHIIKFRDLVADFIKDYAPPTEFQRTKEFRWEFKDSDIDYNAKWQDYHMENSALRWICAECNIKLR